MVEEDTKPRPSFKIKETSAAYESGKFYRQDKLIFVLLQGTGPQFETFLIKTNLRRK